VSRRPKLTIWPPTGGKKEKKRGERTVTPGEGSCARDRPEIERLKAQGRRV